MGHPCAKVLAQGLLRKSTRGEASPRSLLGLIRGKDSSRGVFGLTSPELGGLSALQHNHGQHNQGQHNQGQHSQGQHSQGQLNHTQPCQQSLPPCGWNSGDQLHAHPQLRQNSHLHHDQYHEQLITSPTLPPLHPLHPLHPLRGDPAPCTTVAAPYSTLHPHQYSTASSNLHLSLPHCPPSSHAGGASVVLSRHANGTPGGLLSRQGGAPVAARGLTSSTGSTQDSAMAQTPPTGTAPRAPLLSAPALLAPLQAQLSQVWKAARALRAVQALARGWEAFQRLPPVSKRISEARAAIARRQEAAGIQLQAFWRQHAGLVTAVGGGAMVLVLDQVLLTLLYPFIAHPLALSTHLTTLGLSASSVLLTGAFLNSRTAISVDSVTAMALSRLNAHPGVLEVLGAPISPGLRTTTLAPPPLPTATTPNSTSNSSSGSTSSSGSSGGAPAAVPVHGSSAATVASAMVGGGVRIRFGLRAGPLLLALDLPPRTCVSVFAARGAEATGLVSAVVTKHHGQYTMELLAVDVQIPPSAAEGGSKTAQQQRVFVLGTPTQCSPYDSLVDSLAATFRAAAASEARLVR